MNGYCTPDLDPLSSMNFYELAARLHQLQRDLSYLQSEQYKVQKLMESIAKQSNMFKGSLKTILHKNGPSSNNKYLTFLVERRDSSNYLVISEPDIKVLTFN